MAPVLAKLRYRDGMRVAVHGAPAGFEQRVAAARVTRAGARARSLDLVHAFFTRRAHLERALPRLAASLAPGGVCWLSWPKSGALATDLARDVVRDVAERQGWRAVSVVSVDEVWSALRVVAERPEGPRASGLGQSGAPSGDRCGDRCANAGSRRPRRPRSCRSAG
jgi:hypothetical protein